MSRATDEPSACGHCGIPERQHSRQWTEAAGWHSWTPPTDEQIKARMQARRGFANQQGAPEMTTAEYYRDHKRYEEPFTTQTSALRFLSAGETNSLFLAWALVRDDGTRVDGDDLVDLLPNVPHGEMPEGWEQ